MDPTGVVEDNKIMASLTIQILDAVLNTKWDFLYQ